MALPPDPGDARPGMTHDEVQQYVTAVYASRGVTPREDGTHDDIGYWTSKYFDPAFKGDYKYWQGRLESDPYLVGMTDEGGGYVGDGGAGMGLWDGSDTTSIPGRVASIVAGEMQRQMVSVPTGRENDEQLSTEVTQGIRNRVNNIAYGTVLWALNLAAGLRDGSGTKVSRPATAQEVADLMGVLPTAGTEDLKK